MKLLNIHYLPDTGDTQCLCFSYFTQRYGCDYYWEPTTLIEDISSRSFNYLTSGWVPLTKDDPWIRK